MRLKRMTPQQREWMEGYISKEWKGKPRIPKTLIGKTLEALDRKYWIFSDFSGHNARDAKITKRKLNRKYNQEIRIPFHLKPKTVSPKFDSVDNPIYLMSSFSPTEDNYAEFSLLSHIVDPLGSVYLYITTKELRYRNVPKFEVTEQPLCKFARTEIPSDELTGEQLNPKLEELLRLVYGRGVPKNLKNKVVLDSNVISQIISLVPCFYEGMKE